jgi:hypothetical protein
MWAWRQTPADVPLRAIAIIDAQRVFVVGGSGLLLATGDGGRVGHGDHGGLRFGPHPADRPPQVMSESGDAALARRVGPDETFARAKCVTLPHMSYAVCQPAYVI